MYFTEFTSRLSLTSLFKFSKSFAREGKWFTPFTFLVVKLKEMKCSSKSAESLTSRLKIFIFSSLYMTIDPGTSSVVASCLVWLNFCLPFSGPCSQDFLAHASPRICSSFRNRKEPMAHFQNAFFCFWLFNRWQWFWKHF